MAAKKIIRFQGRVGSKGLAVCGCPKPRAVVRWIWERCRFMELVRFLDRVPFGFSAAFRMKGLVGEDGLPDLMPSHSSFKHHE
ncbi:MAG: hypothetical protein EAZ84_05745 [Verrucomicrobia bacterium]|nr:MAG: hypothetical protein EAZ84_05745 [Verrucomicrobiota bacterium]TAE86939.1 MAG: hypothetical protein EAZ82_09310 [Verrucomicrobiota bacterium]TAF24730.1 MAG: hypothetical protein EAZ71_09535 [Verrucomicrobiota bacterium]